MATQETRQLDEIVQAGRRTLLKAGGSALAGLVLSGSQAAQAQSTTLTDNDYLNFALNLEYLEAEYYTLAVSGVTINALTSGTIPTTSGNGTAGGAVTVKSSPAVPFATVPVKNYATETALDERRHVNFLRNALGTAYVAQPSIDLLNSFNALATYAGLPSPFDPFANEVNFLLGAFIFEDVGVTAYKGAAAALSLNYLLVSAAGILGTEAYHAGLIRTTLYGMDQANPALGIASAVSKIATARAKLDGTYGTAALDEVALGTQNLALNGSAATFVGSTIIPADANTIAFSRTTAQVLSIVYAGGSGKGGFFPSGMNGTIK